MNEPSEEPIRASLKREISSGTLFSALGEHRWHRGERGEYKYEEAVREAAAMHESSEVDLLHIFRPKALRTIPSGNLFPNLLFYCDVLPKISGDIDLIMETVRELVLLAGRDLISGRPNQAFLEWLQADASRPNEALRLIEKDLSTDSTLLSFVLVAGAKFDLQRSAKKSIELSQSNFDHVKLPSITALGRMNFEEGEILKSEVLDHLCGFVSSETGDLEIANGVSAIIRLQTRSIDAPSKQVLEILRSAARSSEPQTQWAIIREISSYPKSAPSSLLRALLPALLNVDPEHTAIIDDADSAFVLLLERHEEEEFSQSLHSFLTNGRGRITQSQLSSTIRVLKTKKIDVLGRLLASFYREGSFYARREISNALYEVGDDFTSMQVDFEALGFDDDCLYFTCRKACGFLSAAPVAAASYICCAIRAAKENQTIIARLLFDPLLLNYSGSARTYLEKTASDKSDLAQPFAADAIGQLDRYLNGVKQVGEVQELLPPSAHRLIAAKKTQREMAEIHKQGLAESVLMSTISKSVILYGMGTVSYFDDFETGESRRHETKMASYGTNIEFPRMETLNPIGRSFANHQFKFES